MNTLKQKIVLRKYKNFFILLVFFILLFLITNVTAINNSEKENVANCWKGIPYAYNPPTQEQIDSGEIKLYTYNPCEVGN